MNGKIIASAIILIFTLLSGVFFCSKTPHYAISRFVHPDTCGGCHTAIFSQWKNSMHNLSLDDIIFRSISLNDLKNITDREEIIEAEHCMKCHTPLGYISGNPKKTSDDIVKIPEIAKQGIQCDFCHSVSGSYSNYNAEYRLKPGNGESDPGTKRGPREDAKSDFHKTAYSSFHTRSDVCGTCHNVKHLVFGTLLDTTFNEWKKSPYNSADPDKRLTCQDCHMRQRPGIPSTGSSARVKNPGKASDDGPQRDHVYTHYFSSVNSVIPSTKGDIVRQKLTEETLKNSARIEIKGVTGKKLLVSVINTGAGHCIPTGVSHLREVWLEITILDAAGRELFSSGRIDHEGNLDKNAVRYTTVFGDGKGMPVGSLSKAREILKDRRLVPLKETVESFNLSGIGDKEITVTARLNYRIMSQSLADRLLGKGKMKIPLQVMAEDRKTIKL